MTDTNKTPSRRTVVKGIGAALATPLAAPFVAPALAAEQRADPFCRCRGADRRSHRLPQWRHAGGGRDQRRRRREWPPDQDRTPRHRPVHTRRHAGRRCARSWTPSRTPSAAPSRSSVFRRSRGSETTRRPTSAATPTSTWSAYAKKNRAKYWNFFQVDPPETYYGQMFPRFLEKVAAGRRVEADQRERSTSSASRTTTTW